MSLPDPAVSLVSVPDPAVSGVASVLDPPVLTPCEYRTRPRDLRGSHAARTARSRAIGSLAIDSCRSARVRQTG